MVALQNVFFTRSQSVLLYQNSKPNLSEVLEVLREDTPAQREAASEGNQW